MSSESRAFRASAQLQAVCSAEGLPTRVRDLGRQVQQQLETPVRLALVGRPYSGKVTLVNGLVGAAALPTKEELPPMILSHGTEAKIWVTTTTGEERSVQDTSMSGLDERDMALIRITAPLPLLEKITLLTVPLEGDAQDVAAALAWTATQADVVLWCTQTLTEQEQYYWCHLPKPLSDHAFLAVLRDQPSRDSERFTGDFRSVHYVGTDGAPFVHEKRTIDRDALANLRQTLLSHVSSGRLEDIEGALIFLERYLPRQRARGEATSRRTRDATAAPSRSQTPGLEQRVLSILIERSRRLVGQMTADTLPQDRVKTLLNGCTEILDTCLNASESSDILADILTEATDLMLLMQLEASPDAMNDAIALMVQVRKECEQVYADSMAKSEASMALAAQS